MGTLKSRIFEVYPDKDHFLADARAAVDKFAFSYSSPNRKEFTLVAPGHSAPIHGRHPKFRKLTRPGLQRRGYEAPSMGLMSFILNTFKIDVMYDIGAAQGYYAAIAASTDGKSITAHAFEMGRGRFRDLTATVKENQAISGKIVAHRAGMSDRHEGLRDIWFSRRQMYEVKPEPSEYREAWHRRLKFALAGIKNRDELFQEPVLLTTIDAMVESTGAPQFIKLDVDGYEGKIIAGATDCIAKYRPFILLELHKDELIERTGWSRRKIASTLFDAGYSAAYLSNHDNTHKAKLIDVVDRSYFERQQTMHFLFY